MDEFQTYTDALGFYHLPENRTILTNEFALLTTDRFGLLSSCRNVIDLNMVRDRKRSHLISIILFDMFSSAYTELFTLPQALTTCSDEPDCISARHLCYWIRIIKSVKDLNDHWYKTHTKYVNFLWLALPKLLFYSPTVLNSKDINIVQMRSFTMHRIMSRVFGNLRYRSCNYNADNYIIEGMVEFCNYLENDAIIADNFSTIQSFYALQLMSMFFMRLRSITDRGNEYKDVIVNELNRILSYVHQNSGQT